MKLKNIHILILILIVAAILRMYDLFNIPFTHDEFSALFRLEFDNFQELIAYGVRVDGHPAGIHVFLYYWTALFGRAEWVVKLPFILFGIASIRFIFKIGKLWKNETVGLIAASFMAVSQFTVMYSQIARPYISGLFFSLLMVFFWSRVVLSPNKRFYQNLAGFILGASFCTYNHHFSMLFAVIVGLLGMFVINKKFLLRYILAGLIVFIIYLPHLEILLYQMSMGGVEGWLSKPSGDFLWRFVQFMFNYSWWFMSLVLILILYGIWKGKGKVEVSTYLLFGTFFLTPFLVGFFYSKYVNAVLQFSVLIFSAPYLYFLLFGHIGLQKVRKNTVIVGSILLFGIMSLVFERHYYSLFYENYYEHSLQDLDEFAPNIENIPKVVDARKDIVNYYLVKQKNKDDFLWYDTFETKQKFIDFLERISETDDYFYLSLNSASDPTIVTIVQNFYPNIVELENYFNGTNYLFAKTRASSSEEIRQLVSIVDFESKFGSGWSDFPKEKIHNQKFLVDQKMEWCPKFEADLKWIVDSKKDFIDVIVQFDKEDQVQDAILVMEITDGDEQVHWSGAPVVDIKGTPMIFGSLKLSDIKTSMDGEMKVYIWNKGHEQFRIIGIKIYARKGNPIIYGLLHPF